MVLVPKHVIPILEQFLGTPDEEPQQLLVREKYDHICSERPYLIA